MIYLFVSHLGSVGGVGCPTIFLFCPWKGVVGAMPRFLWYSPNAKQCFESPSPSSLKADSFRPQSLNNTMTYKSRVTAVFTELWPEK